MQRRIDSLQHVVQHARDHGVGDRRVVLRLGFQHLQHDALDLHGVNLGLVALKDADQDGDDRAGGGAGDESGQPNVSHAAHEATPIRRSERRNMIVYPRSSMWRWRRRPL